MKEVRHKQQDMQKRERIKEPIGKSQKYCFDKFQREYMEATEVLEIGEEVNIVQF